MDPTERFTNRVEDYVKYRPGYPDALLEVLRDRCGLSPDAIVADIGSGTGRSSELFLHGGHRVYGVEPNAAMRAEAEHLLAGYPAFTSIDGRAEATTLPDACANLVVAGQAFHWFDRTKARVEFARILRSDGWVVLMWNDRRLDGSAFLRGYEALLLAYGTDYRAVNHRNVGPSELAAFFGPRGYEVTSSELLQPLDYPALEGRLRSSSYAPAPGQQGYSEMITELHKLFEAHEQKGHVTLEYDTVVYFGQLT